jgi:hypothetical protein
LKTEGESEDKGARDNAHAILLNLSRKQREKLRIFRREVGEVRGDRVEPWKTKCVVVQFRAVAVHCAESKNIQSRPLNLLERFGLFQALIIAARSAVPPNPSAICLDLKEQRKIHITCGAEKAPHVRFF